MPVHYQTKRYRIISQLGRGYYGETYLAEDPQTEVAMCRQAAYDQLVMTQNFTRGKLLFDFLEEKL